MKIRTLKVMVVVLSVYMVSGCIVVINGKSVQGSGNFVAQEREVGEFNKVNLKNSGRVFLTPGEKQSLIIKTDDNIMPLIKTDVSGKKLTISHGRHHLRPTLLNCTLCQDYLWVLSFSGKPKSKYPKNPVDPV